MLCISCHFGLLKPLTLQMDLAKLFDVLTSLPVSHAKLPRAVYFAGMDFDDIIHIDYLLIRFLLHSIVFHCLITTFGLA